MTDDLLSRLAALDRPRSLPAAMADRLERVLMAEADGMGELAVADSARPLPEHVRDRLEETLVRVAVMRPLPMPLRNRLERELVRPERSWRRAAVAAAVLFLLAATASFMSDDRPPASDFASERPANESVDSTDGMVIDGGGEHLVRGAEPRALQLPARGDSAASRLSGGVVYRPYPAPPYSVVMEADYAFSAAGEGAAGPPPEVRDPPALAPLRIGVIGGDDVQEAGFRAYVELVNAKGGAGGHRLDVVGAGPSAGETIATVNLSRSPVADHAGAPVGTRTPLVESVEALEPALRDAVFSLSSVPERQARLAVAAALGAGGARTRAVIYTAGSGPFSSRIPDALERSLRSRGAEVVRIRWDPAFPVPFVDAGVAFVSLPTDDARSWLRAAKAAGYAPTTGIWGIWSLADESLLADMPGNVRALSPYELVSGDELRDLTTRTGKPPSARLVHGWATAKWLAVSIWSSEADDNAELARALADEGFWSGFSPPLDYRPDTHSRTPEAIVLRPSDGRLVAEGAFRRE